MHLSTREKKFEDHFRKKLAAPAAPAWRGIAACAVLTWLAFYLQTLPFAPFTLNGAHPLSAVLLALLLGLLIRRMLPSGTGLKPGVDLVIKKLLPIGIVLLGAGLDFYDLIRVGFRVLLGAIVLIVGIIFLTRLLSRLLRVETGQGLLIGVGTAICGTSAIVALAPVVDSKEKDIAISIASINLLGVLAMFVFPFAGALLSLSPEVYGEWCGLAIHATPQVIAAGFAHQLDGETAGKIATIVKLTRISLLGPLIFVIGVLYARYRRQNAVFIAPTVNYRQLMPAFLLFFVGMAMLRTMGFFPEVTLHMADRFVLGAGDRTLDLAAVLGQAGKWVITAAIAGIGLITEFRALRTGGLRPLALCLLATVMIALLGLGYAFWR
ncbi:MAG: putative sulfate exporter family transporter [Bryobacterales bacterium]|nr:putative sulfate exporter family transporter [Bryobacterales bacterium]